MRTNPLMSVSKILTSTITPPSRDEWDCLNGHIFIFLHVKYNIHENKNIFLSWFWKLCYLMLLEKRSSNTTNSILVKQIIYVWCPCHQKHPSYPLDLQRSVVTNFSVHVRKFHKLANIMWLWVNCYLASVNQLTNNNKHDYSYYFSAS